jgi:hypothetical protein
MKLQVNPQGGQKRQVSDLQGVHVAQAGLLPRIRTCARSRSVSGPEETDMSGDMLMRLGSLVGRDASPLDVDLAAAQLGRDPLTRDALIDLAALGITRSAWRQGPVEDWHVAGRIGQVEMMRANAATSRHVRSLLSELLPERWWTRNAQASRHTDALLLWSVLAREIGSVDRRLPDGRTVAELAPDEEQAGEYRNNVLWCRARWLACTAEYGL